MKKTLTTAVLTAIIGVVLAFFLTNLITSDMLEDSYSVKTVEEVSTDLADPDPEVFNYSSLNPTVEVYVGGGE